LCISGLSGERENGAGGAPFFSLSFLLSTNLEVRFSRPEMLGFLPSEMLDFLGLDVLGSAGISRMR
jgi:hypothetical protein